AGKYSLSTLPILHEILGRCGKSLTIKVMTMEEDYASPNRRPRVELAGPPSRGGRNGRVYDVAISYATEDIDVARRIAQTLRGHGRNVFFDEFETGKLWGTDLYQHLHDIYSSRARYCIVIVSRHYSIKKWTRHELKAAQERQLNSVEDYLLPLRVDDSLLPGIPETMGYLDVRKHSIDVVVIAVLQKLEGR
ncbi:MAG TPA: toll/interleukin-1 receptor domain-containing protein, partial [Longimicrobium sp.]